MNQEFIENPLERGHTSHNQVKKLYEKGFSTTPLPSVNRPTQQKPVLNVILNSVGKRKSQVLVVKQQSTVFQTPQITKKASDKSNKLRPMTKEQSRDKENVKKPHNLRSRMLIDRYTGKKEKRESMATPKEADEESGTEKIQEPVKIEEVPANIPKSQSRLDKYIRLALQKSRNIEEFIYLKKQEYDAKSIQAPNPYNLKVVDYEVIRSDEQYSIKNNKVKEYFTISKKGLCHYINNKPVDFLTLEEWLQERSIYEKIKNLKFFDKFRKWKTVNMWKRNVIRHKIEDCSKMLEEKLFLLNPHLRSCLLNLRKNSLTMSKDLSFLATKPESSQVSVNLDTFKLLQEKKRREVTRSLIEQVRVNKELVSAGFEKCLVSLQSEQKTQKEGDDVLLKKKNLSNKANRRENAYEFLGFGIQMSYEQRSELRKQCSKFIRFSYLADFMFLESLADIYHRTLDNFTQKIEQLYFKDEIVIQEEVNQKNTIVEAETILQVKLQGDFTPVYESEIRESCIEPFDFHRGEVSDFSILYHLNIKPGEMNEQDYTPVIKKKRTVPTLSSKWLSIEPSSSQIVQQIHHCIVEGLNSLKHFQRWSKSQEMQKYINVLEDWDDIVCDSWQVSHEKNLDPNAFLDYYSNEQKIQKIKGIIQFSFEKLQGYIKEKFTPYLNVYYDNEQIDLSIFQDPNLVSMSESMEKSLQVLEEQKQSFVKTIPISTDIGLFKLESSELKAKLIPSPTQLSDSLRAIIPKLSVQKTLNARKWLVSQSNKLRATATQINEYVDQVTHLKEIKKLYPIKKRQIDDLAHLYQVMHVFKIEIKDRKLFEVEAIQAKDQLQQSIIASEDNAARQSERFAKLIRMNLIPEFQKESNKLKQKALQPHFLSSSSNIQKTIGQLQELSTKLKELENKKAEYQLYIQTLGVGEMNFQYLSSLKVDIESRRTLWETLGRWEKFEKRENRKKVVEFENEDVESEVEEYEKIIAQLSANLQENEVLDGLSSRVDKLSIAIPMIKQLRNPHLNQDHWNQIRKEVKFQLEIRDGMLLSEFINLKLDPFKTIIREITSLARVQNQLQSKYKQIQTKWRQLPLKTQLYKSKNKNNKEVYQFVEAEETMEALESLVVDILLVVGNKSCKPIISKVTDLEKTLKYANVCFEEWIKLFQDWIYLDNLFSSIDNKKAYESTLFEAADKGVKLLMKAASKSKNCFKILTPVTNNYDKIKELRSQLKKVSNSLTDFLNDKRKNFPRFFFVKNEDLLRAIQNCTSNNNNTPQHNEEEINSLALKCFAGIDKVEMESERISGITMVDGEVFKKSSFSSFGEIDQIFNTIQDTINEGVKKLMRTARVQDKDKKKWILRNHLQSAIAVLRTQFTQFTEVSILNQAYSPQALEDYYLVFAEDLRNFIVEVSKEQKLADRIKLQAVIALQICHRDNVERFIRAAIKSVNQYLWLSQIRFYNEDIPGEDTGINVQQMLYSIKYGGDYIKANTQLLWTTINDKFILNLLANFKEQNHVVVGNPLPNIESLSNSLGYEEKNYYCSEDSSLSGLVSFMTGVHSIGIWGVFHNFDRLNLEVLSKLALILKNTNDLLVKNDKRKQIDNKSHFPFILSVSNPQLLPNSYREFSRTYAPVTPDYTTLIKLKLMAKNYQEIQKVFVIVDQVLTEIQEKYKQHQNIRIKLLESIESVPYNLGTENIQQILLKIVADYVTIEIFETSVKPFTEEQIRKKSPRDYSIDMNLYTKVLTDLNLVPNHKLLFTVKDILNSMDKECMIVVGNSSYKSTAIKVASLVASANLHYLDLSLYPSSFIFGYKTQEEESEGLISKLAKDETSTHWLIIEGSNKVAEGLLQYVVKHKKLIHENGEVMSMKSNIKIIFESLSLSGTQEGFIDQSSIVYCECEETVIRSIISSWEQKFVPEPLKGAFEKLIEDCFFSFYGLAKQLTTLEQLHLLKSFLTVLETFCPLEDPKKLRYSFLMSIVWGLFGTLAEEFQPKIDFLLRKHFEFIPATESIFNIYLQNFTFKLWKELIDKNIIINNELVITEDIAKYKYFMDRFNKLPNTLLYINGPSNTGKSILMNNLFLGKKGAKSHAISLRNHSSCSSLRNEILSKMETFRKDVIIPKNQFEETRILIDDITETTSDQRLDLIRALHDKKQLTDFKTYDNKQIQGLKFALAGNLKNSRLLRHTFMLKLHLPPNFLNAIWDCILHHSLSPELKKNSSNILSSCSRFHNKVILDHPTLFFNHDFKKLLMSFSGVNLKDLEQAKRYLVFSMQRIYSPRLLNSSLSLIDSTLQPLLQKGPYAFSSIRNNQIEQIKDRKNLMNVINQRIIKQGQSSSWINFIVLDSSMEHILRLHSTLWRHNSIIVGGVNQGRMNGIRVVVKLCDYRLCEVLNVDSLEIVMNQLYKNQIYNKTIVSFKIQTWQDVQTMDAFFGQDLKEKFKSQLKPEELMKNEKIMKLAEETSIDNIIEQYKTWLKHNLKFVCMIDDLQLWNKLAKDKPHLLQIFQMDYYSPIPSNKLQQLALTVFEEDFLVNIKPALNESLPKLAEIHITICQYLPSTLKQFQDYLKLYSELLHQFTNNLNTSKSMYLECIDRMKRIQEEIGNTNIDIDKLRQESMLLSSQITKIGETNNLTGQQQVAVDRYIENQRTIEENNKKLAVVLDKRIQEIKRTTSALDTYDEERLKLLRVNIIANNPLMFLLQLLMILIGEDIEFNRVKEVMNDFKSLLERLKEIRINSMSAELVKKFRTYSKKEEMNYEFIKKVPMGSELANIYISFKNLIVEREKQSDLVAIINSKEADNAEIIESLPDLLTFIANFKEKQKMIDEKTEMKSEKEKHIQDHIFSKSMKQKLVGLTESQVPDWRATSTKLDTKIRTLQNNLLLMSAYFIYLPHLILEDRKKIFKVLKSKLNVEQFSFYEQLDIDDEYMRTYNIEEAIFENMLIMNNCLKPMLMLDQESKGLEWMKTFIKDVKYVKEEETPNFMEVVAECISTDTHLIIEISTFLTDNLEMIIKKMDDQTPIKIGDKEYTFSPEFKLYIVTNKTLEMTEDILDKLTVINFAPGIERIQRDVRLQMIGKTNPQFLHKYADLVKRKISIRAEHQNQKKCLIEIFFKSTEITENLIKDLENPSTAVTELNKMFMVEENNLRNMKLPESSEIVTRSALCFYNVLLEFKTKSAGMKFNITDYLRIVRKGIKQEAITDEKSLFRYVYRYYEMGISLEEKSILNLLLVFSLLGVDKPIQNLLSKSKQQIILALKESGKHEKLLNLIDTTSEESIKALMRSPGYFTLQNDLSLIQKIILIRVVSPPNQLEIFDKLVSLILGDQYLVKHTTSTVAQSYLNTHVIFIEKDNRMDLSSFFQASPQNSSNQNVLHIRRLEQLEVLERKGFIDKSTICLEGIELEQIQGVIDQLAHPVYIVITKETKQKERHRSKYPTVRLQASKDMENKVKRIISRVESSPSKLSTWRILYLHQLISFFCKIHSINLQFSLDLCERMSLSLESASEIYISEQQSSNNITSQEQKLAFRSSQIQIVGDIIVNTIHKQHPDSQYHTLVKETLARIMESEGEYSRERVAQRISEEEMAQFLNIQQSKVEDYSNLQVQRLFTRLIGNTH